MKSNLGGLTSLVLVIVASSSLISMIALTRVDSIVHTDLYRYGLNFSYEWAMPYWTMTTFAFAMGWVNIFMVIALQFYVLAYGRGKVEAPPQKTYGSFATAQPEDTENAAGETIFSRIAARPETALEDPAVSAEPSQAQEPITETSPLESAGPEQFEFERENELAASFESLESEFRPHEENEEARWTAMGSTEAVEEAPQEEYQGTTLAEEENMVAMRFREDSVYAEERETERNETPNQPFETEPRVTSSFVPEDKGKAKEKEKTPRPEAQ